MKILRSHPLFTIRQAAGVFDYSVRVTLKWLHGLIDRILAAIVQRLFTTRANKYFHFAPVQSGHIVIGPNQCLLLFAPQILSSVDCGCPNPKTGESQS